MHQVLPLVVLFSVLLLGTSLTQDSYAAVHPFELQWGESGTRSGNFIHPQQLAIDSENSKAPQRLNESQRPIDLIFFSLQCLDKSEILKAPSQTEY